MFGGHCSTVWSGIGKDAQILGNLDQTWQHGMNVVIDKFTWIIISGALEPI